MRFFQDLVSFLVLLRDSLRLFEGFFKELVFGFALQSLRLHGQPFKKKNKKKILNDFSELVGDKQPAQQSHLLDLLDVDVAGAEAGWVDPWGTPAHPADPPAPVMPPRPKVYTPYFFLFSNILTDNFISIVYFLLIAVNEVCMTVRRKS